MINLEALRGSVRAAGAAVSDFIKKVRGNLGVVAERLSTGLTEAFLSIRHFIRTWVVRLSLVFRILLHRVIGTLQIILGGVVVAPLTLVVVVDAVGKWLIADGAARVHGQPCNITNFFRVARFEVITAYFRSYHYGKRYGTWGKYQPDADTPDEDRPE